MRALALNVPKTGGPLYRRIAAALREALTRGRARPGEPLPSTRVLAEELGVHRNTVVAALSELQAEGWVVVEERRAFRVADVLPDAYLRPGAAADAKPPARRHEWTFARTTALAPFAPAGPVRFSFEGGLPDFASFPLSEFRGHVRDALRRPSPALFDYGEPGGHPPLVAALEDYLRRMRGLTGRPVLVTNGSQEGLFLAAQLLVRRGDVVAMEEYGYIPAREAFRAAGARVVALPMEREGLDPGALDLLARRERVRLLFLTPLHQFPTTVTMPEDRRRAVYESAARHGIILFEDDYDHEFHYRTDPPPPLASRDPDERVVYASTFSKILFPAARIGFLVVPEAVAKALVQFRRIVSHQNDALVQDALARWFASGGLERHLARMRRHYQARRDALVGALTRVAGPLGWSFDPPDGGMALWLDTGTDSERLAAAARRAGIFVTPGAAYRVEPGPSRHVRIGFSSRTPSEIHAGVAALAEVARPPS